ncbi:zinc finger domain-containing protein [Kutzneria chonburiensis]|uniref:DNA-binding phage zinc finger domain-containing protein n=1 Tax=Kutzneria chonburiensis TaxID=1483604 RepID=A0ABV6N2X1_9PSEU|nr:hypothetical protein [Kutzneria chonburiensis]
MRELEVRALLATCMAYDHRRPGDADLAAWTDAATRGRWTFAEANEAIRQHYATTAAWIMPGHVDARIRAGRQQPPRVPELPPAAPAAPSHVRAIVDQLAARLGWRRPPPVDGVEALAVQCPSCLAAVGRPCTRQVTRGHRRGQLVAMNPHPSRRELAARAGPAPP